MRTLISKFYFGFDAVVALGCAMSAIDPTQFAKSAFVDEFQTAEMYRRLSKNYGESQLGARLASLAEAEVSMPCFGPCFSGIEALTLPG